MVGVRATVATAIGPAVWRVSLDERLADYEQYLQGREQDRDLDHGFVWGVRFQELYPEGMQLVTDSAEAERWSGEVGLPFHEAVIQMTQRGDEAAWHSGQYPRPGWARAAGFSGWFDCLMAEIFSRWGEHGPRPAPLEANADLFGSMVVQESVEVDCTPRAAWQLITDISRIGEFSPECVAAEWLGPDRQARVGARFEGTNRVSDGEDTATWVRPCTVTVADIDRRFAYVVGDRYDGTPASEWEFTLEQLTDGRCQISQTFRHLRDGLSGLRHFADADPGRAAEIVAERIADLAGGMRATLHRMKATLEGGSSKLLPPEVFDQI